MNHIAEFAVAAVGHSEAHTEVEQADPRTGEKQKVCPVYGSIPCKAHQATMSGSRGKFDFKGVPASFVCDATGKLVSKVDGQAPQKFIDALNEAQGKIGKAPVRGSMIAKMERDLYKGDALVKKGKFKAAHKAFSDVAEDEKVPTFVRTRAKKRLEGLVAAVTAAVEEAKAKDGAKAKRELEKLLKEVEEIPDAKAVVEAALGGGSAEDEDEDESDD